MSGSIAGSEPFRIRPATVSDEPAIRACAEAAYARYVPRIGRRPAPMDADFARRIRDGHVDALASDTLLAGYAIFYPRGDHIHLENVAVHPDFAGRGMGGALLRHVEDRARLHGLRAVELYTNGAMTENLALYPHLGYAETGRRVEDGFNRVYFRKTVV